MYIRECVTTNKVTKTKYVTHRLVEAYRVTEGSIAKVRQRIIMHLGTLELPKSDWPKLAKILEARLAGQNSLFEDDTQMATAADKAMDYYSFVQQRDEEKSARKQKQTICAIDLESVEHTMNRSLGPELVVHAFWERLGFDQLLQTCGLSSAEQSWAQAVVLGRLIQPASERQTDYWLKKKTSLLEMLEVDLSDTGKNAIYEIGDTLLSHKKQLEKELRKREEALFPQEHSLFLYDLTNTYFEGGASKNTSAHRGHSKEKRSDCPLVTLALVVDGRGFPIFSQIYKGNQSEPETLEEILKRLYVEDETLFMETLPTIVMDRGIATKNNLELLKEKNPDMIILAGFMWLVPGEIIRAFPQRIVNIHPALLPKFGGKGMYGDNVHKAVSDDGETETGITIHYVNEYYDEGQIIFQQKITINPHENPEKIAQKVHELEYKWYPEVILKLLAQ